MTRFVCVLSLVFLLLAPSCSMFAAGNVENNEKLSPYKRVRAPPAAKEEWDFTPWTPSDELSVPALSLRDQRAAIIIVLQASPQEIELGSESQLLSPINFSTLESQFQFYMRIFVSGFMELKVSHLLSSFPAY